MTSRYTGMFTLQQGDYDKQNNPGVTLSFSKCDPFTVAILRQAQDDTGTAVPDAISKAFRQAQDDTGTPSRSTTRIGARLRNCPGVTLSLSKCVFFTVAILRRAQDDTGTLAENALYGWSWLLVGDDRIV